MKRLILAAGCALVACAGLATPLFAGSFGLFYAGRHCSQCGVCVRPYNAFTPVICGDVCGTGCSTGCGGGGCAGGGCAGGCGGDGYGCDPGYRMCGRLAPIGAPCAGAYCGALNQCPADGYGLGAFGSQCCGRLKLFGNPVCGGCCGKGCKGCGGGWDGVSGAWGYNFCPTCDNGYGYGYAPAPEGHAPATTVPAPAATPAAPLKISPEGKEPPKSTLPAPVEKQPNQPKTTARIIASTVPGSASPGFMPALPVSYQAGYQQPQQMPYGYGYDYSGYGYGYPMNPAWMYQGYYGW